MLGLVVLHMAPTQLVELANLLEWEPFCNGQPKKTWLAQNRGAICNEIFLAGGHSVSNWFRGHGVNYNEIVTDVANKFKDSPGSSASVTELESFILQALCQHAINSLTPEQKQELYEKLREEAQRHGVKLGAQGMGAATLVAAKMGGFATYMLASTLLGAVNGALGLGLGFGVFAGMSKAIAVVIGPIGWALLGGEVVRRLGAPKYKKLLPIVVMIAMQRRSAYVKIGQVLAANPRGWFKIFGEVPENLSLIHLQEALEGRALDGADHPRLMAQFNKTLQGSIPCTDFVQELVAELANYSAVNRSEVAEAIFEHIERIRPQGTDQFLLDLMKCDASYIEFCYWRAPTDGVTHFRAARESLFSVAEIFKLGPEGAAI